MRLHIGRKYDLGYVKPFGVILLFHVYPNAIPRIYRLIAVEAYNSTLTDALNIAVEIILVLGVALNAPLTLGAVIPDKLNGVLLCLGCTHIRHKTILGVS